MSIGSKIIIILGSISFIVSILGMLISFKSFNENKPINFTGGIHGNTSGSSSAKGLSLSTFNTPDVWDALHTILFKNSPLGTAIMEQPDVIGTLFGTAGANYTNGLLTDDEFRNNFAIGLQRYSLDNVKNHVALNIPKTRIQGNGPSGGQLGGWIPQQVWGHGTDGFQNDDNQITHNSAISSGADGYAKDWIIS